jgi:photosystem II stability/assembly factor-like uncharacterized protein
MSLTCFGSVLDMKKSLLLWSVAIFCVGCGNQETVIPTDKLTQEQIEKVKAEDKAVAAEEGGRK